MTILQSKPDVNTITVSESFKPKAKITSTPAVGNIKVVEIAGPLKCSSNF